jgi:microcystin-dependent protein
MAEPFLGEIRMFAGNFAIYGWAFCEGQLLPISQNTALFSLLGTTYGGNGTSDFALPDLRGRTPVHAGQGAGLSPYVIGQVGGAETVTLTEAQVAAHTHAVNACNGTGTLVPAAGHYWANDGATRGAQVYASTANTTMNPAVFAQSAGGGQPVSNIIPYLAVSFIISLFGIYPSRN